MAAEDRALQLDPLIRRDDPVGERPEPGVDPVDGAPGGVESLDQGSGRRHPLPRRIADLDRRPVAGDADQVAEAERGTIE
jgi:hypothetical protein